ncbi:sensor histidine kinase [Nocardia sp. 348MFTsu5.1]|uniref:sensor histidine kinase n=1 Tax=Nocardia sp. 348MFTsu5.1 TaxID=1172185 RepID=UPI000380A075|nr:sensor histidine kinase [Nocardia sp. 348MFTsu5.1]
MRDSSLTPVFAGLQNALHVLIVALSMVVLLRALLLDEPHQMAVVVLTLGFMGAYLVGVVVRLGRRGRGVWIATLTLLWLVLIVHTPDAAYIAFGLFFVYLRVLPPRWNLLAVAAATALAIVSTGVHRGWSVAGVVGPVIGACVAVVIGVGYRTLYREARERQRLIDELVATREVLAAQERASGILAERERLAQDIHDTVAQGLSSIQLLLHAAERADPQHPAIEKIRMARDVAADSLAETRQLIAELTPAALEGQTLGSAVRRICTRAQSETLDVHTLVEGEAAQLPMPIEAALVRITQSAMANVVQHAQATRVQVTLTYSDDVVSLDVVDDGIGFDVRILDQDPSESFGLNAIRRRVEQLHGSLDLESEPGHTALAVSFPIAAVETPR